MIVSSLSQRVVENVGALLTAIDAGVVEITVLGRLVDVPTIALRPGQALLGAASGGALRFRDDADGVQLSADNRLEDLALEVGPSRCAVSNNCDQVDHFGHLALARLRVIGCVRLMAGGRARAGHIKAHEVDIIFADARGWNERPTGYGVEVIPGVFALWNRHTDPTIAITAELTGISIGRPGRPARGSGVFVGGNGPRSGRVVLSKLETGDIQVDGGIAPGTPDRIAGGVFLLAGGVVDLLRVRGAVATYGANDMVVDNWGTIDTCLVDGKLTSYGPSGVGFVNFGVIGRLDVSASIETFGEGARGFNVYDGTVRLAEFDRVVTHADGAVGIQISQPIGLLRVRRGIETHGGIGQSLVKGVQTPLPATALSIKSGGRVDRIEIMGGLRTRAGVAPLEIGGTVGSVLTDDVLAAPALDC